MNYRKFDLRTAFIVMTIVVAASTFAYGQGVLTTGTLSGVVVDSSHAVLPGADVVAKHNATNTATATVTEGTGGFTIPGLSPGVYTVTVSLMGFKTVALPDVTIVTGTPTTVRVVMEVGGIQETITVTGAADILQTQTTAITTTLATAQIDRLPLPTRNTIDIVTTLSGVNTTGVNRYTEISGLSKAATNITIDGLNVTDQYQKSTQGFNPNIKPQLDAIEEVTVSSANPGAQSAGHGAVQISFVTRQGTNRFQGSVYQYNRNHAYNTPYWFNKRDGLPKDRMIVNSFGFRLGGPVIKDRLFFFFNYENFRNPLETLRNRTVVTQDAVYGLFSYNTAGGVNTVDLYSLAAKNGQISTPDTTILQLLNDIQGTLSKGTLKETGNPTTREFTYQASSTSTRHHPTGRIDYNLTQKHRVGVSIYYPMAKITPDTLNNSDAAFPGFPNEAEQTTAFHSFMGNVRSTVRSNMVNEVRFGYMWGPFYSGKGYEVSDFQGSIANMDGFALVFPIGSNPYRGYTPAYRDMPVLLVEDTLSWVKGRHAINIGASFTQVNIEAFNATLVPQINFGVDSNDPAIAMFATGNFPGASSADLASARSLYALLTGRVTAINGRAYLDGDTGKYVYLGDRLQLTRQREFGVFVQDSFRVRQNLTVNYGVRYELQMPFVPLNDFYSKPATIDQVWGISGPGNLFKPGVMNGTTTQLVQYTRGEKPFNTDLNNIAPSGGVAWRPSIEGDGWLKRLLGSEPVFRGGYSLAYLREGMQAISSIYGSNPGGNIDATRNIATGNLVSHVSELPLLFREKNLGPASFPDAPDYPITGTINDNVRAFDPNTQVPYAHSISAGYQRELTKNTAVEIRYVGTRMRNGWITNGTNLNEYNLLENGFLEEFKLAQANLQANIAAGRGANFRYYGSGTGTSPLPTYLAYFSGVPRDQATDPGKYTSSNFASSTFYNHLAIRNPSPLAAATALHTNAGRRESAIAAGLPLNFFVVNPTLSGAYIAGRSEDGTSRRYDALQIELRRRMTSGLQIQGSYQAVFKGLMSQRYTLREPQEYVTQGLPIHAFKVNWLYQLPFGQGHRFLSGAGRVLNALVSGWTFDGTGRVQSGNTLDFGNFRLVGMTDKDLQKMFKVRMEEDVDGRSRVYMLPKEVIENTIKAFSVSATSPTGYGALGPPNGRYLAPISGPDCIEAYMGSCGLPRHHYVHGPMFARFDVSVSKRNYLTTRVFMDLRVEALNLFDNVNFIGVTMASPYTSTANYEVTQAFQDISNTQDPGGRLLQLSWRISW